MFFVITGDGKGKTTSCLGHMVRAVGQGKRAIMFQFIKGPWISGEHKYVDAFSEKERESFNIVRGGRGFVGIEGDNLSFEEHKGAALDTLKEVKEAFVSSGWDMIILDEVHVAISLGLVDEREVLEIIKARGKIICITSGRGAPESFMQHADVVSRVESIFHHYDEGGDLCKGFDF